MPPSPRNHPPRDAAASCSRTRNRLAKPLGHALRAAHLARLAWWWLKRPVTLGCRVLVMDAAGRVLLVRHSYVRGWHLPGGGVARGESLAAAARRELREEVGIEAEEWPRLLGIFLRLRHGSSDHVAVFVVRRWHGEPRSDSLEIAETGFFPPDALPPGTTAATRRRIDEWRGRLPVAEFW